MTGAERLGAALSGRFADRRMFAPMLSLYGRRYTGAPTDAHYADAALYARGYAACHAEFGPDLLFSPFAFALEAAAYGAPLRHLPDRPPVIRRPAGTSEEIARRPPADPARDPGLAYLVESAARLTSVAGGGAPVVGVLSAPCDLPALLVGAEAWIESLLARPAEARSLLDLSVEHCVALGGALAAAGCACVAMPCAWIGPQMLPRARTAPLVAALETALRRLPVPAVLHHASFPFAPFLDLVAPLPNVAGFALSAVDEPGAARALVGPGKLLLHGPFAHDFPSFTPSVLAARCAAPLAAAAGDPAFILSTSAADVPPETDPAVVRALAAAAAEAPLSRA